MRRPLPGLYLCLGVALAAVSVAAPGSASSTILFATSIVSAGAIALAIRAYRPPGLRFWLLLEATVATWAIAAAAAQAAGLSPQSLSTTGALSQIPGYLLFTAATVTLVRASGRAPIAMVDATLVLAAFATALWPVTFAPAIHQGGATHLVGAGIVAADLGMLTLLLRAAFSPTGRVRSFQLILGSIALMTAGDTLNMSAAAGPAVNHAVYALYVPTAALVGVAGVHPSMRLLPLRAPSVEASPRRSVLVLSAAVLAPMTGLLLNRYVRDDSNVLPYAIVGLVMSAVVVLRLAHIVRHVDRLRLRAEASEQKFRMMFDYAGIGISIGSNGMLTETNDAYQRMLGYTADEMAGMHYTEVTHPDDINVDKVEAALVASGEKRSLTAEKRLIRRDGKLLWARVTVTAAPDRSFGIGLIEDVTDRRRLLQRTVEVAEAERMALATDLHDGPIQRLTAAALSLDLLGNRLRRRDHDEDAAFAQRIREEVAAEMASLRQMMAGLRPPVMDERGLDAALRDCAETVLGRTSVMFTLDSNLGGRTLAPELETAIYRLVREALTNVRKHANASRAHVRVDVRDGSVGLEIDDDGSGFDPRTGEDGSHLGLLTMRERVESLGGTWSLIASPGAGTRISAKLPADAEVGGDDRDGEPVVDAGRARPVHG